MRNLLIYLKERFPLAMTSVLSGTTAMYLVAIAQPQVSHSNSHLTTFAIALSFLFFMLRMRVTDEFKDSSHDTQNYPNRPVQRGLIQKRTLVVIGLISLTIEMCSVIWAGLVQSNLASVYFYLLILGYSGLTGFEFFASRFLDRHFNLYLVLHQAIFILYPIWVLNIFGTQLNNENFLAILAFIFFMSLIEIIRKYELRYNPAGEVVKDTYLAVWRGAAFWIIFGICLLAPLALYIYFGSLWLIAISAISAISLLVLRRKNESVRTIGALTFVATGLVTYLS